MIEKLVLGTVQLGIPYGINNSSGKPDIVQATAILDTAKKAGITTLDTANAYGNATEVIGSYQRASDLKFKVISKFHSGSNSLDEDVKRELELLHAIQFEAYLFHSFHDFETVSDKTAHILSDLRSQKLINKIGVSIYSNEQFEMAIGSSLVELIQLPYNLLDNDSQRGDCIKKAKAAGKELHVRSVFLQGLFFMNTEQLPEKLKPLRSYLEEIKRIAAAENLVMQELALIYALQNRNIDKVLIGVDSVEQLNLNLAAAQKANLPDDLRERINAIHVAETELLSPVNWK